MTAELPRSPLPREPRYWDELAKRIVEDASDPLAAYAAAGGRAPDVWYAVLSRRALWWVAAASAVIVILRLGLPASTSSTAYRWIQASLAPEEAAGRLMGGPAPPSVGDLMVRFSPGFAEGEDEVRPRGAR